MIRTPPSTTRLASLFPYATLFPSYGFHRVDGMAARDGDAGFGAYRRAAFQYAGDGAVRQDIDGHADECQGQYRLAAHGVDIRQRVGGDRKSKRLNSSH